MVDLSIVINNDNGVMIMVIMVINDGIMMVIPFGKQPHDYGKIHHF